MSSESPKRFKLSSEAYAKERVEGIRTAVEEIKKERPEVLALGLFGSLVKGNSTEESDIDAYVYVNADVLKERYANDAEAFLVDKRYDFTTQQGDKYFDGSLHWIDFRKDIEDNYDNFVRWKVWEQVPTLREDQLKNINSYPISDEIVDKMVEDILASYTEHPDGVESTIIHFSHQLYEGEEAQNKPEGRRVEPNQVLSGLFFLVVGGSLKRYRKRVIDKLMGAGPLGEKVWTDLERHLEAWEQKVEYRELPTDKHYPRTLEEALRIYGK